MSTFHKLAIKNYIQETANAVSLVFDIPENLKTNFSFKAGLNRIDRGIDIYYSLCLSCNILFMGN